MYKNGNKLIPFQQAGVDWLITGHPAKFLCDDCGLGKTVQVVAAAIKAKVPSMLVVCLGTPGVKESWVRTAIDWGYCEPDEVQIVRTRSDVIDTTKKFIAVSFELLLEKRIVRELKTKLWGAVVVDEEHVCKTLTSQRSKIIFGKDSLVGYGYFKWLLSATPMPNYPVELYPALATLRPELIGNLSYEGYLIRYCGAFPEYNGYGVDYKIGSPTNVDELKRSISSFILRREISEVYPVIPPVIGKTIYIDIGDLDADKHNTPMGTLQRLTGEAKTSQVIEYVLNWLDDNPDDKLLVYAYHKEVMRALRDGLGAQCIYGGMSPKNKLGTINTFSTVESQRVLVAQISCLGTAYDGLQKVCNHIIFAEPNWSPGVKSQGVGRLQRHGQTKPTYVTEIIAEKTIDETKIGSCYNKQLTIDVLLSNKPNQTEDKNVALEDQLDEIISLLKVIAAKEDEEGNEETTNADGTKTKRKRRTKAEIEAAEQAKGAATQTAQPSTVSSATNAAPSNVVAMQQPAFQPAQQPTPINGAQLTWQDVEACVSSTLSRLQTQMQPENPQATLGAAQALLAVAYKDIAGAQTPNFQSLATQPQFWSALINRFNATNHQVPTTVF